jgi:transcriptional regulator with XRE-family HTH domain
MRSGWRSALRVVKSFDTDTGMLSPQPDGLPTRLREAREKKGYSHRGASRHLGCSAGWIGQLERGEKALPLAWAIKVADLYGVTLDWLATGKT